MVVFKFGMFIVDVCFDILDCSFICLNCYIVCLCFKFNFYFLINEIKVCNKEFWKLIKYIYCGILYVFCEIVRRGGYCL